MFPLSMPVQVLREIVMAAGCHIIFSPADQNRSPRKQLDHDVFRCKGSLLNQSFMVHTQVITPLDSLTQVSQIADTLRWVDCVKNFKE